MAASREPVEDPQERARLDAEFQEWVQNCPPPELQRMIAGALDFWHEPTGGAGHYAFGMVVAVQMIGDERWAKVLTVGDTPGEPGVFDVPVELLRPAPTAHPLFVNLLEARAYAKAVGRAPAGSVDVEGAQRMLEHAWMVCKQAFDTGLPGERPEKARVRIEDLRNPDMWGLKSEASDPPSLRNL